MAYHGIQTSPEQEDDYYLSRRAVGYSQDHKPQPSLDVRVSEVLTSYDVSPSVQYSYPPRRLRPPLRPRNFLKVTAAVLVPFPFYVLAGYVIALDGSPAEERQWDTLFTVMKLTVSIFPVIFGIVVSMSLQALAAFKLERVATLGVLERLMGSLSLGSYITTTFNLGALHRMTIPLLLLWAVSPLGGQSAVNIAYITFTPVLQGSTAQYFNTRGTSGFVSDDLGFQSMLNAIYAAALYAPDRIHRSPVDLWGNVKIPYLSSVAANAPASPDGWLPVNNNSVEYSSLLGIPTQITPSPNGNATFTMQSSYLELNCGPLQPGTPTNSPFVNTTGPGANGTYWTTAANNNTYSVAINGTNGGDIYPPWIDLEYEQGANLTQQAPWGLLWMAGPGNNTSNGFTECGMQTVYVEANISCVNTSCAVTQMRPSTEPHPHSWQTDLACEGAFMQFVASFLPALGQFPTAVHPGYNGPAEQYLGTGSVSSQYYFFDLSTVTSTTDFSNRLGQLVNTYWYGSYMPNAITGNFTSLTAQNKGALAPPASSDQLSDLLTTPGTNTHLQLIYKVNRAWISIFIISITVMMAAALLSALFLARTKGPRVLGSVASLLRDGRHVDLPPHLRDSTADVQSISRHGENLRLALVDVAPHEEFGRVAVQQSQEAAAVEGRLDRRRLYF